MYSRYKKIKVPPAPEASAEEDMPLLAAKIEDNTFGCWLFASQTNVIYLLLGCFSTKARL